MCLGWALYVVICRFFITVLDLFEIKICSKSVTCTSYKLMQFTDVSVLRVTTFRICWYAFWHKYLSRRYNILDLCTCVEEVYILHSQVPAQSFFNWCFNSLESTIQVLFLSYFHTATFTHHVLLSTLTYGDVKMLSVILP